LKKEEGRRKKEEGRRKKEEGRRKKEEVSTCGYRTPTQNGGHAEGRCIKPQLPHKYSALFI
jgi:ribosomal protein S26